MADPLLVSIPESGKSLKWHCSSHASPASPHIHLALFKQDTNSFAFKVLSFGYGFFAPAKKMNPSDMTEDTASIWATASFAGTGVHKLEGATVFSPSDMTEDTTSIRASAGFARKGAHKLEGC